MMHLIFLSQKILLLIPKKKKMLLMSNKFRKNSEKLKKNLRFLQKLMVNTIN